MGQEAMKWRVEKEYLKVELRAFESTTTCYRSVPPFRQLCTFLSFLRILINNMVFIHFLKFMLYVNNVLHV